MIIRPAKVSDAPQIAKVHVDSWRSTYTGIMPEKVLAGQSYARREKLWERMISTAEQDQHYIFVAENESGQVVGFADGGAEREGDLAYAGELYAVYLLEATQRKGLGKLLVTAVTQQLLQHSIHSMLVWVLADNPSRQFYERLGAIQVMDRDLDLGGSKLKEVAYGWSDIAEIMRSGA